MYIWALHSILPIAHKSHWVYIFIYGFLRVGSEQHSNNQRWQSYIVRTCRNESILYIYIYRWIWWQRSRRWPLGWCSATAFAGWWRQWNMLRGKGEGVGGGGQFASTTKTAYTDLRRHNRAKSGWFDATVRSGLSREPDRIWRSRCNIYVHRKAARTNQSSIHTYIYIYVDLYVFWGKWPVRGEASHAWWWSRAIPTKLWRPPHNSYGWIFGIAAATEHTVLMVPDDTRTTVVRCCLCPIIYMYAQRRTRCRGTGAKALGAEASR